MSLVSIPYLSPFMFDSAIAVPLHVRARRICCFLRKQISDLMRAPRRHNSDSTSGRHRACPAREAACRAELAGDPERSDDLIVDAPPLDEDLAARRGPPVPPDHCTTEGQILVSSPRHCLSHGWTSRVRVEHGGSRTSLQLHGIASPHRSPSPSYTLVTPLYTPTTPEPPGFKLPLPGLHAATRAYAGSS